MKKIFTLALVALAMLVSNNATAGNTTITTAAQLKAAIMGDGARTATDVDTVYVPYNDGALYNVKGISTTEMPKAGTLYVIGVPDENTGALPWVGWQISLPENTEGDHLALIFENLKISHQTVATDLAAGSKYPFASKDTLKHYIDSLVFRHCDLYHYGRAFYRIEVGKLANGNFADGGRTAHVLVENCRMHEPQSGNNDMPTFYFGHKVNTLEMRNNTFYDLNALNKLVGFNYMDDNTGREEITFDFHNNTVVGVPKATLLDFGTFVAAGSTFNITNNIFYYPWWSDDFNNNGLTEEQILELKSQPIAGIANGIVDIRNNFIYGYKEAKNPVGEDGEWLVDLNDGQSNYLHNSDFDLDPIDFSNWELDEFMIATHDDNLSAFYTAGTDGSPIGDINNYTTEIQVIVPVQVNIEGSKSASVTIKPNQQTYKAGDEITLTVNTKGRLNTFEGWSNGETAESITITLDAEGLDITAKFKELDYVSAWNLEQLTKNNTKLAAPLAPNYGDENVTLNYARWQEATEAVEPTEENPEGVEAQPEGYRDVIENAIETRNNKVSGDLRNCFFISTPVGVFNVEGSHSDYAYISIPEAKNGHHLQLSVASDNIPYKHYTVDYLVEGAEEWVKMGEFEMTATGKWFDYDFALPLEADGKATKVRVKGVEADGLFVSEEMQEAGTEPTREFLFVSELYLVNGEPIENGIATVNTKEQQSAPVYNLMGMKVNGNVRGLYIQNGRKFVVK